MTNNSLINKDAIKKLESSEAAKSWPGIINFFEQLAEQMKGVNAGLADVKLEFHTRDSLKIGEYVPLIIFALVTSDSIIHGDKVELTWVDGENSEDEPYEQAGV